MKIPVEDVYSLEKAKKNAIKNLKDLIKAFGEGFYDGYSDLDEDESRGEKLYTEFLLSIYSQRYLYYGFAASFINKDIPWGPTFNIEHGVDENFYLYWDREIA